MSYCKFHNERIIQLGSCLTCDTISPICEFKGCIKHHEQNERVHNIITIEYVRNIVNEYMRKDSDKRSHLKKLISDYFQVLKKHVEELFESIYESVADFRF